MANVSYVSVTIAAIISLIALVLNIVKTCIKSTPTPFRRKLEYEHRFGDYLSNLGLGPMKITSICFLYCEIDDNSNSLVDLYSRIFNSDLSCSTYFENGEILNRWIEPKEDIKLIELDPKLNKLTLDQLNEEREKITIIIGYKSMFWPFEKTIYL